MNQGSVLVTAFDAFGSDSVNPSELAVQMLPSYIQEVQIHRLLLPTVFGASLQVLKKTIDSLMPDAVLCVGQAGGRAEMTPERVAINIMDARIPDNAGQQPIDEPIAEDGETAYFSTLPVKAMVLAMRKAGLPAMLSNSAGTYVCNYIMYGLLHHLQTKEGIRGGFIHVPFIPAQLQQNPGAPSLELEKIVRGLEICIETIIHCKTDIRSPEGAEY